MLYSFGVEQKIISTAATMETFGEASMPIHYGLKRSEAMDFDNIDDTITFGKLKSEDSGIVLRQYIIPLTSLNVVQTIGNFNFPLLAYCNRHIFCPFWFCK